MRLRLRPRFEQDCPPTADRHRLEQVFGNLLANALKFTPAGGRVIVDGSVDDGNVVVRVIDTGCGIEPDVLPHVFERFRQGNHTTARSVGGLGLGLFIVRRLVQALQGQVVAESAGKGAGATFTVALPVAATSVRERSSPRRAHAKRSASAAARPDLSDVHVLVVDDEADAREMMSSALDLCGATVTTAESTREALARLGDGRIDVLLADLAIPHEDGYEADSADPHASERRRCEPATGVRPKHQPMSTARRCPPSWPPSPPGSDRTCRAADRPRGGTSA